jgi:prephenate dehydrogenase
MEKLNSLRQNLDQIDLQIVSLLNKRMEVADEIAQWKRERQTPLTDQERENLVITQVQHAAQHPVLKDYLKTIYQTIMDCAKASRVFGDKKEFSFTKVGIVGLGLIGGSIAKAIKAKSPTTEISTIAWESLDNLQAMLQKCIEREYPTIADLVQHVELVILAVPLASAIALAKEIFQVSQSMQKPCLVIDIASVKREIVAHFESFSNDKVEYISTHPMAGSEKKGFENSLSTLFTNAPWIIIPHRKNTPQSLDLVKNMIAFTGAKPISMDAETHDKQTALVSHLPNLLSWCIFNFVKESDPSSLTIAGPGFQSMTRLAHGNPALRAEMLSSNRLPIKRCLDAFVKYLNIEENKFYKNNNVKDSRESLSNQKGRLER